MFPGWTWIVGFWIGAAIGSFLNVVIYRLPRRISLSDPPKSFCPNCKHPLGVLDLVPLLSWLFLRGRCRYCKVPVSSRYFFVELMTASIWGGIWWRYLCQGEDPARAICYAFAASALVAIIFIDWELLIIPDEVNAALALIGIGYNVVLYAQHRPEAMLWGIPSALAGWIVGVAILWGIALLGRLLFRKDAMGHGDIKMARGIGAVLFPALASISFAVAVVFGAVLGVLQLVLLKNQSQAEPVQDSEATDAEEYLPPESIGSLFKCGLGYVLGFDIIGLFLPKFYERYFGESPFMTFEEEYENFEVERTMIPFGPYLALGAIVTAIFGSQFLAVWDKYVNWMQG